MDKSDWISLQAILLASMRRWLLLVLNMTAGRCPGARSSLGLSWLRHDMQLIVLPGDLLMDVGNLSAVRLGQIGSSSDFDLVRTVLLGDSFGERYLISNIELDLDL